MAWGTAAGLALYRLVSIGIAEKHVREVIEPRNIFDDRSADADLNAALAWQSAHRPLQRGVTYGLDGAYPSRLQPLLLRAYEWASTRWHEFLHQPSKKLPAATCPEPVPRKRKVASPGASPSRKRQALSAISPNISALRPPPPRAALASKGQPEPHGRAVAGLCLPQPVGAAISDYVEYLLDYLPDYQVLLCVQCRAAIYRAPFPWQASTKRRDTASRTRLLQRTRCSRPRRGPLPYGRLTTNTLLKALCRI